MWREKFLGTDEVKGKWRKMKWSRLNQRRRRGTEILHLPRNNWPSFYNIVLLLNPKSTVRSPCFFLTEFITWSSNYVVNSLCFLFVCLLRSFLRISNKYFIDSRPNLYLLRSSLSVNWSRSISSCRNFFPRVCANGKSAILFVLTNFFGWVNQPR